MQGSWKISQLKIQKYANEEKSKHKKCLEESVTVQQRHSELQSK